jgi:hypothetical protein
MTDREKYREFCKKEKNIPIFSKDWWLDSVCGYDNWNVILMENNEEIVASFPYFSSKKYNLNIIGMPILTQTMGIYIKYPENQQYMKKLSYEKKIINHLIEKLPKFARFSQSFHYTFTNWLSFYWKNYKQTTNYTYVIEDLSNLDEVYSSFSHAKRKNIKKSEKILTIQFDLSCKDFYDNHKYTLSKQGLEISYSFKLFEKLYNSTYENEAGRTIYAIDGNNNIHGALFVIWDDLSAYDLISTIDPDYRNSGSASLLIKEIIRFVSTKTNKFDFEGSMIENVENSFRQFGAIQKPYFYISKTNSKLLKVRDAIRDILK